MREKYSIRQKHKLLKQDKASVDKALGETFKPIVSPLEKLVNVVETNKQVIKVTPRAEASERDELIKETLDIDELYEISH